MERIMEVIGSIRRELRRWAGETDASVRVPFERRLDTPTPCSTKRRLDESPQGRRQKITMRGANARK
jgi:hypothetical protein